MRDLFQDNKAHRIGNSGDVVVGSEREASMADRSFGSRKKSAREIFPFNDGRQIGS